MNKNELLNLLEERRTDLKKLVSELEKTDTQGTLSVKKQKGKTRFFRRDDDKRLVYLGSDCRDEIARLCNKHYESKLIQAAELEGSQIDTCIALLKSRRDKDGNDLADIDLVHGRLPDIIRQNVSPNALTDDGYAQTWQSVEYGKRWTKKGDKVYETSRGEKVRSKSEWIIAGMLAEAGVPYRYEEIVPLNADVRVFLHPDFTVLNKRTRKVYYWEHFGKMDDQNYINNTFMPKMAEYYNFNFLPGDKLLMTFESGLHPLDTTEVKRLIEKYLL